MTATLWSCLDEECLRYSVRLPLLTVFVHNIHGFHRSPEVDHWGISCGQPHLTTSSWVGILDQATLRPDPAPGAEREELTNASRSWVGGPQGTLSNGLNRFHSVVFKATGGKNIAFQESRSVFCFFSQYFFSIKRTGDPMTLVPKNSCVLFLPLSCCLSFSHPPFIPSLTVEPGALVPASQCQSPSFLLSFLVYLYSPD